MVIEGHGIGGGGGGTHAWRKREGHGAPVVTSNRQKSTRRVHAYVAWDVSPYCMSHVPICNVIARNARIIVTTVKM